MSLIVSEYYGSPTFSENKDFHSKGGQMKLVKSNQKSAISVSILMKIKLWLTAVFLPQGYPESVSDDYLSYQIWDTVQAFCSSVTRTLATYAVLKGSGVGDATATVLSATTTWILKDGCGMVSRIIFAYYNGSSLDANSKQWRFFADFVNDCACLLELLAPLFPKCYFAYIMCVSGVAYSLVGVAGGCTRAALTLHQAKRNNMADVSAKDGSQETLVNLSAIVASLVVAPVCNENQLLTWILFVTFTVGHLLSNYMAVKVIVIDTFNTKRLFLVLQSFVKSVDEGSEVSVLTPEQANKLEPIMFFTNTTYDWMNLGCSVSQIEKFDAQNYVQMNKNKTTGKVDVSLHESIKANSKELVSAGFNSYLLYHDLPADKYSEKIFMHCLIKSGWSLNYNQLCADEYRWFNKSQ